MNKPIKTGLLILLASMIAMLFAIEYRQQEIETFFLGGSMPFIPMLIGGLLWTGVITIIVGIIVKFRPKNNAK